MLLCGGRDNNGAVRRDCIAYNPKSNQWSDHSDMSSAREEVSVKKRKLIITLLRPQCDPIILFKAASLVIKGSGDMIIIGGLIDDQRTTTSERSGSTSDRATMHVCFQFDKF